MRNKLVFLNAIAVFGSTVMNILLGMLQIRAMLHCYGSSINGLVQTGNQIAGYVSLLEAGICASFLYNMYSPMAQKDFGQLSSVYVGFKKSIKKIVIEMGIVAIAVSLIFPLILNNDGLSYFFMASVLFLISMRMIIPYLISLVPKYMIIVMEQRYKAELIGGLTIIISYVLQISLIYLCAIPLQVLLIICVAIEIFSGFAYIAVMKSLYGNKLNENAEPDYAPRSMSKDVMAHTVSRLVFNSTDNIIISSLCSLNAVTIYSNYNVIVQQVSRVFQSIFDGASASMGVKIANEDSNSYGVYRQMLAFAYFVGAIVTSVFIVMINPFIDLWVGYEYRVSSICCILFGGIMYSGILLPCVSVARNAKGLYKESKSFTILQSVVNLVITIALVPKLGILGALLGTFLARICITIPCNYILVEKKVFPNHGSKVYELLSCFIVTCINVILNQKTLILFVNQMKLSQVFYFIFATVITTIISTIISFFYYYIFYRSFRNFIKTAIVSLHRA